MAMPWSVTLCISKMVCLALAGWITSCLIVAEEIASSLRSGDIGAFHAKRHVYTLLPSPEMHIFINAYDKALDQSGNLYLRHVDSLKNISGV